MSSRTVVVAEPLLEGDTVAWDPATDEFQAVSMTDPTLCNGRLTLGGTFFAVSNPVTFTDVSGANLIYFTPFHGNQIALYSMALAKWQRLTFTEISIDISLLDLSNDSNYDVFAWNNSGAVDLELSAAWPTDILRPGLSLQDGIWTKTGNPSRRYLGTFRTTSSTTTEDSRYKRYLWNMNNRVNRIMLARDTSTNSWFYGGGAWRIANADATNKAEVVVGIAEDTFHIRAVSIGLAAGSTMAAGIGVNSVTASAHLIGGAFANGSDKIQAWAEWEGVPFNGGGAAIGYNYFAWLEYADIDGATFYGTAGAGAVYQSGLHGTIRA